MNLMHLFVRLFQREWLLCIRQCNLFLNTCLFFLMFILFFPLTLSPESQLLRTMVPGVIWMALFMACLLSADRMFDQDYEHGVLEQWLVSGYPLSILITARILVQSLFNMLPVLFLCPLIASLYSLSWMETLLLMISIVCATPAIFALCALAAVLGTGVHQRGAFMALIVLPLTLPILIFGSSTLHLSMLGYSVKGHLALLLAFSILSISGLPFAIAGVIRTALRD